VLDRELSKPWVLMAVLPSTSTHPTTFPLHLHVFLMGVGEWGSHNSQNCYFPEAMKQEQQLGTGSIPSSLQIKTFFIDIIYMTPLEIITKIHSRAKLVRYI
jgi:hypothetical protein